MDSIMDMVQCSMCPRVPLVLVRITHFLSMTWPRPDDIPQVIDLAAGVALPQYPTSAGHLVCTRCDVRVLASFGGNSNTCIPSRKCGVFW